MVEKDSKIKIGGFWGSGNDFFEIFLRGQNVEVKQKFQFILLLPFVDKLD